MMFTKISNFITKSRWLILVFWIGIAVVMSSISPNLSEEATKSQQTANSQSNEEAQKAARLMSGEFPEYNQNVTNSVTIALHREGGLQEEDKKYARELEQYLNSKREELKLTAVSSPFTNEALSLTQVSKDQEAAVIQLNIDITDAKQDNAKWLEESNEIMPKLRDYLSADSGQRGSAPAVPGELDVHLTNGNAMLQEIMATQSKSLALMLMLTLVLVLVVLLIIYRSPVAALLPILGVVFALIISQSLIAFAAKAGLTVTPSILEFLIVILFGAGTDYCMLIVSRFKEGLLKGMDAKEALRIAIPTAGEAIISSGFAVIVAFAIMGFANSFAFKALGPGVAIAVFVELLVVMTLIPAILSLLGEKVFWPFLPSKKLAKQHQTGVSRSKEGIWDRISGSVVKKPNRYIAVILIIMLPFILLLTRFEYDNDELAAQLPHNTESYRGIQIIADHFGKGEGQQNAATVILKSDQDLWSAGNLSLIEDLAGNLSGAEGVKQVITATRPTGEVLTPALIGSLSGQPAEGQGGDTAQADGKESIFKLQTDFLAQAPAIKDFMKGYISSGGNSIILNVVLEEGPYTSGSMDAISEIRSILGSSLESTGLSGATAYVGGPTATIKDFLDTQRSDFTFIILIIVGAIYVILAVLLRSLIAPLYMIATIILSFATSIGIAYATFRYLFGYDGLVSTVPIYGFVILVALGVDYNIFLMSKIKEEHQNGKTTVEAIRSGLSTTGVIITSCGIIMAGTFAAFLISPMRAFLELGFAIVVGLLLDTFVIRTLLVPAIAVKFGEMNWWPRKTAKVIAQPKPKAKHVQ
ncbi:MMPL family transporter [Paenibacillus sp. PK3_47]|uniref:MMPL family transporter n=1 Tax=Paenibacillus sp. PK3_47 TaxID=2072642 RepID=UPI00201D895C|nr:MMPL family transporter [Paenibacillus sp. PK3_47]